MSLPPKLATTTPAQIRQVCCVVITQPSFLSVMCGSVTRSRGAPL